MRRGRQITLMAVLAICLVATQLTGPASAQDPDGPDQGPKVGQTSDLAPEPEPPPTDRPRDLVPMLEAAAIDDGTVEVIVGIEEGRDPATTVASALGTDPSTVRAVTPTAASVEITADQVSALDGAPGVVSLEENRELELFLTESIPRIRADVAHADGQTGAGTRIAVIDSGVDATHETFNGAISTTEEACFVSDPGADDPCPGGGTSAVGVGAAAPCIAADCWHGTHVASIAVGRGGDGTAAGVAPEAQLFPIRIFYTDAENPPSDGGSKAQSADLLAAMEHVRQRDLVEPIDALNLSIGFSQTQYAGFCDAGNSTISAKIGQLRSQGIAVVVSSGNTGGSTFVSFPACVEAATAVAATLDSSDQVASYSDTGSPVSLAAPGSSITAATLGGGAATYSGTSMAAPHVSGAIALLRQRYGDKSVAWLEERLWQTGVSVVDPTNGLQLRRIDVGASLGLVPILPRPPTETVFAVTNQGRVFNGGYAQYWGDGPTLRWGEQIVAGTATRSGMGYWLASNLGRVFAYGDARFNGDMSPYPLNQPISAMTTTATGDGYWLLAEDGGIFSFGDAQFYGSTGGLALNAPVTDLARTPTGRGYWLTAKDGGVFSFGDATFYGSTGNMVINQPVVSIAAGPNTGYWLVALDGGLFSFGVPFHGSLPGAGVINETGYRIRATAGGRGYYIATTQGGVYPFGLTNDYGHARPLGLWEQLVDLMIPPE